MLKHMRESHTSFVTSTEQKIDKTFTDSIKEKALSNRPINCSICAYCNLDCQNRRKLRTHIALNHKDDDGEVLPDLKHIRLERNPLDYDLKKGKKGLADADQVKPSRAKSTDTDKVRTGKRRDSEKAKAARTSQNGKQETERETKEKDSKATATTTASTSRGAIEKRYKCFWCKTSFRKRGKLMDHIDMFHKDSKDQSEMEAEKLYTIEFTEQMSVDESSYAESPSVIPQTAVSAASAEPAPSNCLDEPKKPLSPPSKRPEDNIKSVEESSDVSSTAIPSETSSTSAITDNIQALDNVADSIEDCTLDSDIVVDEPTKPVSPMSCSFPQDFRECHATPCNNVCTYKVLGTITEVSKLKYRVAVKERSKPSLRAPLTTCYFFSKREDDPLPVPLVMPKKIDPVLLKKPQPSYSRSISFPISRKPDIQPSMQPRSATTAISMQHGSPLRRMTDYRCETASNNIHRLPTYPMTARPMHMLSPSLQFAYHQYRMPFPLAMAPLPNQLYTTDRDVLPSPMTNMMRGNYHYTGIQERSNFTSIPQAPSTGTPLDLTLQ